MKESGPRESAIPPLDRPLAMVLDDRCLEKYSVCGITGCANAQIYQNKIILQTGIANKKQVVIQSIVVCHALLCVSVNYKSAFCTRVNAEKMLSTSVQKCV